MSLDSTYNSEFLSDEIKTQLGFKELLFLAIILFFGFCGFTVCVDKIYSKQIEQDMPTITVHDKEAGSYSAIQTVSYPNYRIQ